jgi:antitoxin CptB
MRKQDSGSRIQDSASLHPESCILHPELRRLRWRCRRGLLELDIVLGRFVGRYAELDEQQKMVFDELLDLPDTVLWDMISGRTDALKHDQRALLAIINAA